MSEDIDGRVIAGVTAVELPRETYMFVQIIRFVIKSPRYCLTPKLLDKSAKCGII